MPRLFFTTDVHGSDRCFRKFINAAKAYKADALILGGDITGKVLIPIVERPDGRYETTVFGEKKAVGADGLPGVRKTLQDAGQYSFITTPAALAELQADPAGRDKVFDEAMADVLRSWIGLAQERLNETPVKCYISPGNDDKLEIDSALVDSGPVVNPENKVVELDGGYEMITLGYANPTPWKSPREVSEEKLGEMIEALAAQVRRPENAVYNLHVPPIDTELDRAPAVSHDFNYVKDGLGIKFIHAGSTAVRKSIESHAPLIGLHGHIHESKGFTRIGRTLCLNPGSEYADGILRGVLANLQDGKVHDFMLTSG
ncbi:MAG: metallophosphoesterase [Nitrososphaerota archaeon]|nr:metallophosphoesterase [Nitrososphaerota archaeon]